MFKLFKRKPNRLSDQETLEQVKQRLLVVQTKLQLEYITMQTSEDKQVLLTKSGEIKGVELAIDHIEQMMSQPPSTNQHTII